jgi:hypothetical protein
MASGAASTVAITAAIASSAAVSTSIPIASTVSVPTAVAFAAATPTVSVSSAITVPPTISIAAFRKRWGAIHDKVEALVDIKVNLDWADKREAGCCDEEFMPSRCHLTAAFALRSERSVNPEVGLWGRNEPPMRDGSEVNRTTVLKPVWSYAGFLKGITAKPFHLFPIVHVKAEWQQNK